MNIVNKKTKPQEGIPYWQHSVTRFIIQLSKESLLKTTTLHWDVEASKLMKRIARQTQPSLSGTHITVGWFQYLKAWALKWLIWLITLFSPRLFNLSLPLLYVRQIAFCHKSVIRCVSWSKTKELTRLLKYQHLWLLSDCWIELENFLSEIGFK